MKILYNQLLELLGEIPAIKWVDLDRGQFDLSDRPPVVFPCALIEISLPRCSYVQAKRQHCVANFTIRLGVDSLGNTSLNTPEERRASGLEYLDLADQVYSKLQGFSNRQLSPFNRKSLSYERRSDNLKVMVLNFETEFDDVTALS